MRLAFIILTNFLVSFAISQAPKADTLYPSKKMDLGWCFLKGLYSKTGKPEAGLDTTGNFSYRFWMKYYKALGDKRQVCGKELVIVPTSNIPFYDSVQFGNSKKILKCINFKVLCQTDSNFLIESEDKRITAYWEAKNKKGEWKPVEYFRHSTCGNSYESYVIPAKHYITISVNCLEGDFKTKLRLKLRANNQAYYSSEIDGSVYSSAFTLPSYNELYLDRNKVEKLNRYLFLGD